MILSLGGCHRQGGEGTEGKSGTEGFSQESGSDEYDGRLRLTLAVVGSANNLYQDKVARYNREQEDVAVLIKVYEDADAFIVDLMAGNLPDLVDVQEAKVYQALAQKNLLEDLHPYFEKDVDISTEDFLDKSLEFYAKADKLYAIPYGMSIYAMMGDVGVLGDRQGWNFEEYLDFVRSLPNSYAVTRVFTKQDMLKSFCMQKLGDFVDEDARTCDFHNESFYSLLGSAAIYSDRELENEEWGKVLEELGNGEVSLIPIELHDVTTYELWRGFFANRGKLIGFPAREGNGVYLKPAFQALAMVSTGNNKTAAWAFTKGVLTGKNGNYVSFPSYKKLYEEMFEEERRNAGKGSGSATAGSVTVGTQEASLEEIAWIEELLREGSVMQGSNDEILQIIGEEAEGYFRGEKTPEQVAQIIENRVKLYLAE